MDTAARQAEAFTGMHPEQDLTFEAMPEPEKVLAFIVNGAERGHADTR